MKNMNFAKPINVGKSLEYRLDGRGGGGTTGEVQAVSMITRKEMVKAGVGLAAIIAAGKAPASLVRSMLGMHNAMMAGNGLSAKSYVQSGLILQYDGIENVGFGTHDNSASVWVDLTGHGYDLNVQTNAQWTNNGLKKLRGGAIAKSASANIPYNNNNNYIESVFYNPAELSWFYSIIVGGCNANGDNTNCMYIYFPRSMSERHGVAFASNPHSIYNLPYTKLPQGVHQATCSFTQGSIDGVEGVLLISSAGRFSGVYDNLVQLMHTTDRESFGVVLHEVRVYDHTLTTAERAHNYKIDKARFGL